VIPAKYDAAGMTIPTAPSQGNESKQFREGWVEMEKSDFDVGFNVFIRKRWTRESIECTMTLFTSEAWLATVRLIWVVASQARHTSALHVQRSAFLDRAEKPNNIPTVARRFKPRQSNARPSFRRAGTLRYV
jgi:hypothetical protein